MSGQVPTPVSVVVVDDHPVVRWGFREMLATDHGIAVVGEAASMSECLAAVERDHPDVVLLDIRMPDHDGIETARQLKLRWPGTRVLMLTVFDDPAHVGAAFEVGADGYLLKTASCEALLAAIHDVARGRQVVAPEILRTVLDQLGSGRSAAGDRPKLIEEERELLRCLASGASLAEVSAAMHWSAATTTRRIHQLCDKLAAKNRVQAVYQATRLGLL